MVKQGMKNFWLVAVIGLAVGCGAHSPTEAPPVVKKGSVLTAPITKSSPKSNVGFSSHEKLSEHFKKHGKEVGAVSEADYLEKAQALRDAPLTPDIREQLRPSDGHTCRFQKSTGYFEVFDNRKVIHTFFRPNDGEQYFERQMNRDPRS